MTNDSIKTIMADSMSSSVHKQLIYLSNKIYKSPNGTQFHSLSGCNIDFYEIFKRERFQQRMNKLGPEKSKEFLKRYPHRLELCI